MRFYQYILQIFIIVFLTGCCLDGEHDAFYEFNSDEISWQIYKTNDTLKFINQRGEKRNYIVESIVRDTTPYAEKFNFDCSNNHVIEISINFKRLPELDSFFYQLKMMKYPSEFILSIFWEGVGDFNIQNKVKNTITIDGITYTDIYIESIEYPSSDRKFWRWYYSKSKGMIRFDAVNGDIWIRKFN